MAGLTMGTVDGVSRQVPNAIVDEGPCRLLASTLHQRCTMELETTGTRGRNDAGLRQSCSPLALRMARRECRL
jgi:hypothetical protein